MRLVASSDPAVPFVPGKRRGVLRHLNWAAWLVPTPVPPPAAVDVAAVVGNEITAGWNESLEGCTLFTGT